MHISAKKFKNSKNWLNTKKKNIINDIKKYKSKN